jgi:hypothetical protein
MAKRVYFAFHYQDVIDFRANVVRNHNLIEGTEKAGYFDASIWEEARKKNPLALKRMINSELENTTVTAVLVGTDTYARPWVRYEIFKSIERGNSVIGIHINGIIGKDKRTKLLGHNPFDYLGLVISNDGQNGTPREWDGTKWINYPELGAFGINEQPITNRSKGFQLSYWLPVYDWIADNGYDNFNSWIS